MQRRKRLFVLLARAAPVGVILRRVPGSWTQCVTWNTRSDSFERGQWLHGRLYERRSDLSPSGQKLVYFVAKHHLQRVDPSYSSAWTAISTPPYFTAVALWPNRGTTYHGGGLFTDENTVQINSVDHRFSSPTGSQTAPPHPKHVPPARVRISPLRLMSGDQILAKRLVRDGWTQLGGADVEREQIDWRGQLRRECGALRLDLSLGPQQLVYTLSVRKKGRWEERPFVDVDWADFDQAGRLVFARGEKLGRAHLVADVLEEAELTDFTGGKPARVVTPDYAKKW